VFARETIYLSGSRCSTNNRREANTTPQRAALVKDIKPILPHCRPQINIFLRKRRIKMSYLLNDKQTIAAITDAYSAEVDRAAKFNRIIAEANANIKYSVEFGVADYAKLDDWYSRITAEIRDIAFYIGLREGARLIGAATSSDLPERVMRTFNAYEENHTVTKANIRSAYKHKREFEDGRRAGMAAARR
jgi:adenylate kinase family enzyme